MVDAPTPARAASAIRAAKAARSKAGQAKEVLASRLKEAIWAEKVLAQTQREEEQAAKEEAEEKKKRKVARAVEKKKREAATRALRGAVMAELEQVEKTNRGSRLFVRRRK